jgi:hypothetical protein
MKREIFLQARARRLYMAGQYCGFDLPVRIDYVPPAWLLPFIYLTHSVAAVCLFPANLPWSIKIVLFLAALCSLRFHIGNFMRYTAISKPLQLLLDVANNWSVVVPDGKRIDASLQSASILQPGFVVLNLQDENNTKYVFFLTESNLDKQTLRRLRVRLLYPRGSR